MNVESIVVVLLGVWITVITVLFFRMSAHYNKLTKGVTTKTLEEVLTTLIVRQETNTKDIQKLAKSLMEVGQDGQLHLQRIGIVRFNPFSDTGGSQSFTIAILDGKDNGIIMTSLYARTGNRWYIKHIKAGSCADVELSKEEESAIKKAQPV